jgi:hypothetical protein
LHIPLEVLVTFTIFIVITPLLQRDTWAGQSQPQWPPKAIISQFTSLSRPDLNVTVLGTAIGGLFLHLVDRYTPHLHFISGPEGPSSNFRRIWLLILAITIHNFPAPDISLSYLSSIIKSLIQPLLQLPFSAWLAPS